MKFDVYLARSMIVYIVAVAVEQEFSIWQHLVEGSLVPLGHTLGKVIE